MTGPAPRPGRGLKLALALSVALNLMVAGVVAGAYLRGGPPHDLGFGPFAAALTEADRAALKREFRARMPDMREMHRGHRQAMAEVLAALRADPFEPAALAAAMEAAAARMGDRLRIGQDLLIGHFAAMSAADRAAFADRLQAAAARGGRRDRPDSP